ncbi:MAG: hypothetical protein IJ945_05185 [Oscillospiraceae bacterium]|nr:hypothetical protein [Oscillospiraceae bacterium]
MGISLNVLSDNFRPTPKDLVKVTTCGYVTDILYSAHKSMGSVIKKLDKDFYMDTRNGEVKEFHHNDKRSDDMKSVARSIADIRNYINANVTDPTKCKFITLTYAENMRDTKKVFFDFKNFWIKKFKKKYSNTKYISILEPQGRGAWHLHLIVIFDEKAPFIPNEEIANMWSHGFTNTRKIDNVDNVGAYLSAYLGDLPFEEAEQMGINTEYAPYKTLEVEDESGNKVSKKFIKGGRLPLYPAGVHIMRHSKDCIKPVVEVCTNEEAEFKVIFDTMTYEVTKEITDTDTGFKNTINRRCYNSIR